MFPRSSLLLLLMLTAYVAMDLLVGFASGLGAAANLLSTLVDTCMLTVFCALLLRIWRQAPRFHQTFVALLGTGVVVMLLSLPLAPLSQLQRHPSVAYLASFLGLLLFVWSIAIMAYILHHALPVRPWVAFLLATPYQILNYLVLARLAG